MFNPNHLLLSLILPLLIFLVIFLLKWLFMTTSTSSTNKNLPPSPPRLPIIGNFHQIGTLPYCALWSLSQRYGPLMLLHFGKVPTLVVSSPDAAREIMKTHDLSFANRHELRNFREIMYDMKDLATAPYGEHWRKMKSIFVLRLLTKRRLQSFRSLRKEETALMIKKICRSKSNLPVNLRDLFLTISNDVVCRAAFGRKYTESENGGKRNHLLDEFSVLLGVFVFRDYIPALGWLDHLSGMNAKVKGVAKRLDDFLEGLIEERMALHENQRVGRVDLDEDGENFVDVLLKIQQNDDGTGITLSRESIKALLLDAYGGGTDTISISLEWAMAELIHSPNSMKKLQNEVREVLKGKLDISDDDQEKMVFLKAVVKETLRMHPPATIHLRTTKQDTKLMGYDIAAGTMILINTWGIANDPKLWDDPHEFQPERFLNSSIDFKGHDFEYTPFGAGRRQCPGISFATVFLEYVLASLVYKFDWEFPGAMKGEEMDMTANPGSAVHRKKVPLQANATPFY